MFSMESATGLFYFCRVSICTEVAKVVSSLFVFPLKFPCLPHPFQDRTTDPVQLIIFHLIAFITPLLLPSSLVQTLSSYAFIKHFQFMFFYQCDKRRERERKRERERAGGIERERGGRVCVCVCSMYAELQSSSCQSSEGCWPLLLHIFCILPAVKLRTKESQIDVIPSLVQSINSRLALDKWGASCSFRECRRNYFYFSEIILYFMNGNCRWLL